MARKVLNLGSAENSGTGDGLRVAFSKVQDNFIELYDHAADTSNPHSVTAAQVGAIPTTQKGVANGVAALDSSGKLAASHKPTYDYSEITGTPPGAGSVNWSTLTGKPSTFPPNTHSHPISEIVDLEQTLETLGEPDPFVSFGSMTDAQFASPPANHFGNFVSVGDRVWVSASQTASNAGAYVWNGPGVAMTRTSDFPVGRVVHSGQLVRVLVQALNAATPSSLPATLSFAYRTFYGDSAAKKTMVIGTDNITLNDVFATDHLAARASAVPSLDGSGKIALSVLPNGVRTYFASRYMVAVSSGNITSAPSSIDGGTPSNGDRVYVNAAYDTKATGIYVYNGSGSAMTRASDMALGSTVSPSLTYILSGTTFGEKAVVTWKTGDLIGNIVVGTDNTTSKILQATDPGATRPLSGTETDGHFAIFSSNGFTITDGGVVGTAAHVNTGTSAGNVPVLNVSGHLTVDTTGNAATASRWSSLRSITLSSDATGSCSFDGSANATMAVTLANSGVSTGTYTKVTVDAKGRVTVGAAAAISDITGLQTALDAKAPLAAPTLTGLATVDGLRSTVVAKGTVSTGTVSFDVQKAAQTITVAGAQTWTLTNWPTGFAQTVILASNSGSASVTLPSGVWWSKGDGSWTQTFADIGVTLQSSFQNTFVFYSFNGGTTIYGVVR